MIVVTRIDWRVGENNVEVADYRGVLGVFTTRQRAEWYVHRDLTITAEKEHTNFPIVGETHTVVRMRGGQPFARYKSLSDEAAVHTDDPYSRREGTLTAIDYEYETIIPVDEEVAG
jgi:hypothetical protein